MDWQAVQQVGLPAVISLLLLAYFIRRAEKTGDKTLELLQQIVDSQETTLRNQRRHSALMARLLREFGIEVMEGDA